MVRFLVIGAMAALCTLFAARQLDALGRTALAANPPPVLAASAIPTAPLTDREATIGRSADGQFWADGEVNGRPVRFLVDTGATTVALTQADARSLGLDPDTLTYSYVMTTANGPERAAPVRLDEVSVGNVRVMEVQAFVAQGGLGTSLLGMSYLGRLSKVEQTPDSMVLRS
jgi:aspartyl protease family protein